VTGYEYGEHIKALGLTVNEAARLLGISPRTSQRLASGEIRVAPSIEIVLTLMVKYRISVEDINKVLK
jgi:DNA-binding XRE family transcriptional regulator